MSDDRDYLAEMGQRIKAATKGSGWVAGIVAAKLHAQLQEKDPDLLDGWLHAMAIQTLRQEISLRARVERTTARRRASARAFRDATDDAEETGDATPLLGLFQVIHTVDEDNTRKHAADMTGPEHLFVAGAYKQSANETLMLAAFHRAVAKKVGDKRTSEVLDEQQYEELYLSIARRKAA